MDRRQFLQLSALFTASCFTSSCAGVSPRYQLPESYSLSTKSLLLTNASIVDVKNGKLFDERSLLIRNGVIEQLFLADYQ